MRRLPLALGIASVFSGCLGPARQVSTLSPVNNQLVAARVREVFRGAMGGVLILEVSNPSDHVLEVQAPANWGFRDDQERPVRTLSKLEFAGRAQRRGADLYGLDAWPTSQLPTDIADPTVKKKLGPGDELLLAIGFEAASDSHLLRFDVSPAFKWGDGNEVPQTPISKLVVTAELPSLPTKLIPGRNDLMRNVHFGFQISSDGL